MRYSFLFLVGLLLFVGCVQTKQSQVADAEVDENNISPYVIHEVGVIANYLQPCETNNDALCYLYKSQKSAEWEELPLRAVKGFNFLWGHHHSVQIDIVKEKRFAPRDTELYKVQKLISTKRINEPFRLELSEKHIRYRQEVASTIPEFSFHDHPTTIVFNNTTVGYQFLEKFEKGKSVVAVYQANEAPNTIEMIEFIEE